MATDGGRYDVEVLRRRRIAVYWQEESSEVRRCSWFVKGSMDVRYIPYEENIATMLEVSTENDMILRARGRRELKSGPL